MLNKTEGSSDNTEAVVIKKYANRRLYNTESSTYVTLEDLGQMVRADRDFVVFDAKSGDDLTHTVLTQIIVDQESRGQTMLPVPFLRQLIRFYDDSIARMVPGYLQFSLEALAKEQDNVRSQISTSIGNPTAAFEALQVQARRNMAIFERAMAMWTPFGTGSDEGVGAGDAPASGKSGTSPAAEPAREELDSLKSQLENMQQKIDEISRSKD